MFAILYFIFLVCVQWVVTNLKPAASFGSSSSFSWVFDLEGIAEMYQSYDETNLWFVPF